MRPDGRLFSTNCNSCLLFLLISTSLGVVLKSKFAWEGSGDFFENRCREKTKQTNTRKWPQSDPKKIQQQFQDDTNKTTNFLQEDNKTKPNFCSKRGFLTPRRHHHDHVIIHCDFMRTSWWRNEDDFCLGIVSDFCSCLLSSHEFLMTLLWLSAYSLVMF